jgi:hypothetical protein
MGIYEGLNIVPIKLGHPLQYFLECPCEFGLEHAIAIDYYVLKLITKHV